MKNVWITGENGFIARAFLRHLGDKYNVVNNPEDEYWDYWRQNKFTASHQPEIDIFDPTLPTLVERSDVDFILHTACPFETDLTKQHRTITGIIEGTYHISNMCNDYKLPLVYIIYSQHPNAIFTIAQETAVDIIKQVCSDYIIIETDELFGPEDYHGSISQLLMSSVRKIDIAKITADIEKERHYTFIDDFLNGLDIVMQNHDKFIRNKIEIASSQRRSLESIIDYLMEININYEIDQVDLPEFPILESKSIRKLGWEEKYTFEQALSITRDIIK